MSESFENTKKKKEFLENTSWLLTSVLYSYRILDWARRTCFFLCCTQWFSVHLFRKDQPVLLSTRFIFEHFHESFLLILQQICKSTM